ncbi:MAG: formate dehydrogenase accessory sulfurtransferase FdhD [Colwellia sp.]|nr:formate dehydrogenase accessory sulfurtransferase FdhD [Colwellia sp.]
MKKNSKNNINNNDNPSKVNRHKFRYQNGTRELLTDEVIVEQPLQIRLSWFDGIIVKNQVFSITMRTPGDDEVLIIGLLLSEGVITCFDQIENISCEEKEDAIDQSNLWEVQLIKGYHPKISSLERYLVTYSSCGLCGTTSLKSLEFKSPPLLNTETNWLSTETICNMPETMKKQQQIFKSTGGCHAAALFDQQGKLLALYEDIGRHNALDKVLGSKLQKEDTISKKYCLVVSGRLSFELVQKSIMSGICVLIAVGAPSDLAILAAKRFDLTLIGFVANSAFNLYHGEWRLQSP